MKTINQQLDELEDEFRRINITDEDVAIWKKNPITRRFFLEIQHSMILSLQPFNYDGPTDDMGNTAMRTNYSKGMFEAFEMLLEWTPEKEERD